jgi:hypothetical protein
LKEEIMPKRQRSYGSLSLEWRSIVEAMDGNPDDLSHLHESRDELDSLLERVQSLSLRQAALIASKQETSQELRAVLDQAQKLASFLRSGIRYRYGHGSDKLVEFGIQPLRKRRRSKSPDKPVGSDAATS